MRLAPPPGARLPRRSIVFAVGTIAIVLSLAYLVYGGIQQGATY